MTHFQVKTTDLLTNDEIAGLTSLFETVFHKPCPRDVFERKFGGNCLGRSVHSLMFLEGEMIGAFSAIPVRYNFFGRTVLFANTADLMIDPAHRGSVARVRRLAEGLYKALAAEGVAFVFCCLRNEVFELHRAISNWRAIGKVHYYVAPFFGPARLLTRVWNSFFKGTGDKPFPIEKVNDASFTEYRYRILPTNYATIDLPGGGNAVYATELYYPIGGIPKHVRFGLLIDVSPLTKANVDAAVIRIRKRERRLHVLAYQGHLPFQPRDMIRVPSKYEKQPWTLAGRILQPDLIDERVFNLENWNVNLSNGDLV